MIKPLGDWVLVESIIDENGVVSSTDITKTYQKGKIIALGEGFYHHGKLIPPSVKVGDVVYWEAHAEANTPPEIKRLNDKYELLLAARLMAVENV